jgi:hypothetical protein
LADRTTVRFAGVLAILLLAGCGDDDSTPAKDGGADDGGKADSGNGSSGAGGATSHGSGGTKGTGKGTGSGTDDEDGGGSGTPGSGGDQDASTDAGANAGGSMDASTSDGGGTMQSAPGCGGLLDCCANLPTMDRMQCELIANNADDASCEQYKLLVCPQASPDAGTTPDPNACDTLNDCCDALPRGPVRVACASTVSAAVAVDCQQVQAALCTTSGNADACMTLVDCCDSLPPPQRSSCTMVADQGLPAACETVQMALCP